jgi:hypothetical protein
MDPMWKYYDLVIHAESLAGGIPTHPDIVRRWQETKWPTGSVATELAVVEGTTLETATEQTLADLGSKAQSEDDEAAVYTTFIEVDGGPGMEDRNILAMLKESANIVKAMKPAWINGKQAPLRARLVERVFPAPRTIPILQDNGTTEPVKVITRQRPIHVMTARGERSAIKKTDCVENVRLEYVLEVLDDGMIKEDLLRFILEHARRNGLGTDRSQGFGKFTYELTPKEQ